MWFLFWCGEGTKMRGRELVVLRKAAAVAQGCARALNGSLRQPPPSKMLSYCRPGIRSLSTGYGAEIWRSDDSGKGYERESKRSLWNSRSRSMTLVAAGAFSLSFAASMMSVASAKERVDDKYAPREVVLYQYDACPFCNKVKGTVFWHRKPFFISTYFCTSASSISCNFAKLLKYWSTFLERTIIQDQRKNTIHSFCMFLRIRRLDFYT